MDEDDIRPKRPPAHEIGTPLDTLSVGELEERIAALETEIARLRAAIEAKRASRSSADSVFKF